MISKIKDIWNWVINFTIWIMTLSESYSKRKDIEKSFQSENISENELSQLKTVNKFALEKMRIAITVKQFLGYLGGNRTSIAVGVLAVISLHSITRLDTFPGRGLFDFIPEQKIYVIGFSDSKSNSDPMLNLFQDKYILVYLLNEKSFQKNYFNNINFDDISKEDLSTKSYIVERGVNAFEYKNSTSLSLKNIFSFDDDNYVYRVKAACAPKHGEIFNIYNDHYFMKGGSKCIIERINSPL